MGDAFGRALRSPEAHGAFNLPADPVLGADELVETLGARKLPLPAASCAMAPSSAAACTSSRPRRVGSTLALGVPLMSIERARTVLGWQPKRSAMRSLRELIDGIGAGHDHPTPPLAARPTVARA